MVTVKNGQTLLDIALQMSGHTEGVYDLAVANGMGITDDLEVSRLLNTAPILKEDIVNRYATLNVYPATNEGGVYAPQGFSFAAFTPPIAENRLFVGDGQEIVDVALMETGSIESAFDVASRLGISITDALTVGVHRINVPRLSKNKVLRHYAEKKIIPATNLDKMLIPNGVNYWGIEFDFIVS